MISAFWRINVATLIFFTALQIAVPLIPRYALTFSESAFLVGLCVSVGALTSIILRPISGFIGDLWSKVKLMILGTLVGSISYVILWLSTDIKHVLLGRAIGGLAVALFIPASISTAIDYARSGRVGEALGIRSLMVGIGFVLGPGIGGLLSEILGYRYAFLTTSMLLLASIPLLYSDELSVSNRRPKAKIIELFAIVKNRAFVLPLVSLMLYAFAYMGLITFLSAYLKIKGFGDAVIGFFVSIIALSSLVLRVVGGKLADRWAKRVSIVGLLIIFLGYSLVSLTPLPPHIYPYAAILGAGYGLYLPSIQTLALSRYRGASGLLSGIFTMGFDIGILVGPTLLGAIIQAYGAYELAFRIIPSIVLLAALVLIPV